MKYIQVFTVLVKLTPGSLTHQISVVRMWWCWYHVEQVIRCSSHFWHPVGENLWCKDLESEWIMVVSHWSIPSMPGLRNELHILQWNFGRVISDSSSFGPVIITGDFNAHLKNLWGPWACDDPNSQGLLLGEVFDRCSLHAASLSKHATCRDYTYHSGTSLTTADYIFTDIEAFSCIEQCWTLDDDDMNLSDHLPISAKFSCSVVTQAKHDLDRIRIDWSKSACTIEKH